MVSPCIYRTDTNITVSFANDPAFSAEPTNYLIDLEGGIILDVEVSAVNQAAEAEATRTRSIE